ncbi:MAG: hypothetical protein KAT18_07290 [Candidatus Latescibacteria bacterium]|nr:hypothetical protein [Candidatus Latescibacterota bacterium]
MEVLIVHPRSDSMFEKIILRSDKPCVVAFVDKSLVSMQDYMKIEETFRGTAADWCMFGLAYMEDVPKIVRNFFDEESIGSIMYLFMKPRGKMLPPAIEGFIPGELLKDQIERLIEFSETEEEEREGEGKE